MSGSVHLGGKETDTGGERGEGDRVCVFVCVGVRLGCSDTICFRPSTCPQGGPPEGGGSECGENRGIERCMCVVCVSVCVNVSVYV